MSICITIIASAMQLPAPANRHLILDLMQRYIDRKPLNLASKSKGMLTDIKNWINYASTNKAAKEEFARELKRTPEDVEFTLEILQAEIEQAEKSRIIPELETEEFLGPAVPMLKPAPSRLPQPPAIKQKPQPKPTPAAASATRPANLIDYLIGMLVSNNAIELRDGDFIQVKSINQFDLGTDIGVATCPVQALRNTILLLQFARTGLQAPLLALTNKKDALDFIEQFKKCSPGTEWLTREEMMPAIKQLGKEYQNIEKMITAIDVPLALETLYPDLTKDLQNTFKQRRAIHGFIVGTMDIGQITGDRGHYFSLVIVKEDNRYLFLIADTVPESDHIDREGYKNKRIRYLTDIVTKGSSSINLEKEIQKIAKERYELMVIRALARPAQFDYASLSKNDLEEMERAARGLENNMPELAKRTRVNQKQLPNALAVMRQQIRQRLTRR